MIKKPSPAMVLAMVALFVALGGSSYAAVQHKRNSVNGSDVTNSSLRGVDIKNKSLTCSDFSAKTRTTACTAKSGQPGAQGPRGENGAQGGQGGNGANGPQGSPVYAGPNWGIISRNHIGSATAELRAGEAVPGSSPPYGIGSLGISVSDNANAGANPQEKASFGNQVDFAGDKVTDLTQTGFHVFQTGENAAVSVNNLPSIAFEVDPTGPGTTSPGSDSPNFSSLVWVPSGTGVDINKWSGYLDATSNGTWQFTGAAGTATGCNQASPCSFAAMKTAVTNTYPNMTIGTFAVTKGRDSKWTGAVDGLRYNADAFDFEPFGVSTVAP
jgi:hypothetical protein